jgi:ribonuclease HII
MIVGVDEVGRGPLAGSVVVCALAFKNKFPYPVRDSKSLSASRREFIFSWLVKNCYYAVSFADRKEIEHLNILGATFLAAERAITDLIKKYPNCYNAHFIIDGNKFKTSLNIKYTCIKKADKKIAEVACASIIAKVSRDYLMKIADFIYPQWNFSQHKGYPTQEHYRLIDKHRLSPFHRRSFLANTY